MYQDWPVLLQAVDSQGQVVESVPVTIALSQLLPGAPMVTQTTLTSVEWDRLEEYTLRLGVQDPLTGEFSLRFAMEDGQQSPRSPGFAAGQITGAGVVFQAVSVDFAIGSW